MPAEPSLSHTDIERRINRLLALQHGAIGRHQALSAGLSARQIDRKLKAETWSIVLPRVYANAASPQTWERDCHAALIWGGPSAVLSHTTAAQRLGLGGFGPGSIEIISDRCLRSKLVRVHRGPPLRPGDISRVRQLPTTSATRTIFDLATSHSEETLEGAIDSALTSGLTSIPYLLKRLGSSRGRGKRGSQVLAHLLAERDPARAPTESELERLFDRRVVRPHELQRPVFQYPISDERFTARIDFAYPQALLGVEVLGWKIHGGKAVWQRDLRRHNGVTGMGWTVLYFTWLDVMKRSACVAEEIGAILRDRLELPIEA